jgi:hypothetical protein
MSAADPDRTATPPDDHEPNGPSQVALEASLETRLVRLEQFTSGLAVILDRLHGHRAASAATVFDDFDDPTAGNEALDIVFAACSNARRDLTALRRELTELNGVSDPSSEHQLVTRLRRLGDSANREAARFEDYRRSRDVALPPRSPGGVVRLEQLVGMVVMALHELAQTAPLPARPPARDRRSMAGIAVPVAGALRHIFRRRRTRLIVASAAVVAVALLVLGAALKPGDRSPGSIAGLKSATGLPRPTEEGGVAIGGGSPSLSPAPTASAQVEPSAVPPTPRPSSAPAAPTPAPATPRPTHRPTPPPKPPAAVTRFNNRIVAATGSIDGLLDAISAAVQDADLVMAKAGAAQIAAIASTERNWLVTHPPKACYASFQQSAFATYGELAATAATITADADAGDGKAIHKEVANSHSDVAALRVAGSKAVAACS